MAKSSKSTSYTRVLIVDDMEINRTSIRDLLSRENYLIDLAENGHEALEKIAKTDYSLVVCDVKMDGMDGIDVLTRVREMGNDVSFIMITGEAGVEEAIKATRQGAFDFITKPFEPNRFLISVRNAVENNSLVTETKILKRKINSTSKVTPIIGESQAVREIISMIETVAPTEARVLITGPNGSGKELVAHWLHELSSRKGKPMIEVNCAAIPDELMESELFGHEKGAFTGAATQREGKFIAADGGTLFLDEIGDMSLDAQAAVLRVLEQSVITPIGSNKPIKVNVRVFAATNKNLPEEIIQKKFREDLYHRLSVVPIHVPPLRDRKSDIPLLAKIFLERLLEQSGAPHKEFNQAALKKLQDYEWTGNIRELRNVVERLSIFCKEIITEADVIKYASSTIESPKGTLALFDLFDQLKTTEAVKDYFEKEFLRYKLEKNDWNITNTSAEIEMQRTLLHRKAIEYGLRSDADGE